MGKQRKTTYSGNTFVSTEGADESTEERTKEKLTNFRAPAKSTPPANAVATPAPALTTPKGQIPEWMKKKQ